MGILMAWGVPLILTSASDSLVGLSRVQLALLLPHGISVLAGVLLACMRPRDGDDTGGDHEGDYYQAVDMLPSHEGAAKPAVAESLPLSRVSSMLGLSERQRLPDAEDLGASKSMPSDAETRSVSSWVVVAMIGLWRALAVGTVCVCVYQRAMPSRPLLL